MKTGQTTHVVYDRTRAKWNKNKEISFRQTYKTSGIDERKIEESCFGQIRNHFLLQYSRNGRLWTQLQANIDFPIFSILKKTITMQTTEI